MKNVTKKTNGQNAAAFTYFLTAQLDKKAQRLLKGGDDIIVVEDAVDI